MDYHQLNQTYLDCIGSDNDSFESNRSCDFPVGEEYPDPFLLLHVKVIFIALYGLVFACSFIGNFLVILVILKHKKMRSVTNFFLANLAAADLAVSIFCVLPNLSQQLHPYWVLGKVLCKVTYFVQMMSYTASVTILTVMSIERYVAILYPMKSKQVLSIRLLRGVIIIVWIISACCGIPMIILYDTMTLNINGATVTFCMSLHAFNSKAYHVTNLILWYVVPLLLISAIYARISAVLWKSSRNLGAKPEKKAMKIVFSSKKKNRQQYQKANTAEDSYSAVEKNGDVDKDEQIKLMEGKTDGNPESASQDCGNDWPAAKSKQKINDQSKASNNTAKIITKKANLSHSSEGAMSARRRVIRLLIAVIVSFALCVLPYHIRVLWQTYNEPKISFWQVLVTPITFVVYYLNSALNPLLYAFMSANFRKNLYEVLTCNDRPQHRSSSVMMSYSRTINTHI